MKAWTRLLSNSHGSTCIFHASTYPRMGHTWRDDLGIANFHFDPYGEITF
jgi:hypothetical protein